MDKDLGQACEKRLSLHRGRCNNGGPRIALVNSGYGRASMVIEKLAAGVVQVQTPIGPRYLMLSFLQRIYFLWVFRNFPLLPHAVLSKRQQRMIDRMCGEQVFASMPYVDGMDEAPVIGTIERRPAVGTQPLPSRRPVASESNPLAAEVRQQP